jgi:hypothetical protein
MQVSGHYMKHYSMKELIISQSEFLHIGSDLLEFVINTEIKKKLDLQKITEKIFKSKFDNKKLNEIDIISYEYSDVEKAFISRITLVHYILIINKSFESLESVKEIWNLIYETLIILEGNNIMTSIGSQGFASIILYRRQDENDIKILRLHVWDKDLNQYINNEDLNLFAVHSHKFHAQSWILSGEILNTRFFNNNDTKIDVNYFKIDWKVENGEWKSFLSNTMKRASLFSHPIENYFGGNTYTVNSGEFHKSEVDLSKGIASTLFLFNSKINNVDISYVVGPNSKKEGPKYQHIVFDASKILNKLNKIIND